MPMGWGPSGSPHHSDPRLSWPDDLLAAWTLTLVEVNLLESQTLQQTADGGSRILLGGA
jgi:hypothetical protein